MGAVNPQGEQKYWFEGLPFEGIKLNDEGAEKYWFEGLPGESLYPVHPPLLTLLGIR